MDPRRYIDATRIPFSREGFYATNNQFQKAGPKGFIQVKVLENKDLYVRVDLPGVPDDAIKLEIDDVSEKMVSFSGETLVDNHHESVREFSGKAGGLSCDCCVITNVKSEMKDGVLRLTLSRVKCNNTDEDCTLTQPPFTGKSGRQVEDHPFVVKGRKGAFLAEPTEEDGGLYFAVDVPGACADDIKVELCDSEVRFYAEIKNVHEHDKDECGRIYMGSVSNSESSSSSYTSRVKYGVLTLQFASP